MCYTPWFSTQVADSCLSYWQYSSTLCCWITNRCHRNIGNMLFKIQHTVKDAHAPLANTASYSLSPRGVTFAVHLHTVYFLKRDMGTFYEAISLYRRRNYSACIDKCNVLLLSADGAQQKGPWELKMRAMTQRVFVDDIEADDGYIGELCVCGCKWQLNFIQCETRTKWMTGYP